MSSAARRTFDELAEALVAHWEREPAPPDLGKLLHDWQRLTPDEVVELFLTDQSFRWRSAEPLRVEDYLALVPALSQQQELVLELAYGEWRTRHRLGQSVAASEFESRFPELAAQLHQQLALAIC